MKLRAWMVLVLGLLGLRRRRRDPEERVVEAGAAQPRAEAATIVLLLLAAAASLGFVVAYALDASTQVLGATLAGALGFIAAALIVTAKRLVVSEELSEEYSEPDPKDREEVVQIVVQSGSRLTRKRLLAAAAGVAGLSFGAALITPAVSLGPLLDPRGLYRTPWRRGRRLVDARGAPLRAADISTTAFYTAYPEGAPIDEIGSPVVVVRLEPGALRLPAGREGWAPEGILAFSKVCTHAGCAVSLYRTPTFPPTQPRPALVCPCHYSTFDPARGAAVIFGPAGRPLPQLPLTIDGEGNLRAGGNFSGAVGPAWSGVRKREPS